MNIYSLYEAILKILNLIKSFMGQLLITKINNLIHKYIKNKYNYLLLFNLGNYYYFFYLIFHYLFG